MTKPRLLAALLTALAVTAAPLAASTAPAVASSRTASAAGLLTQLPVHATSHSASYDRDKFKLWIDANSDGEDARAEVLKAESTRTTTISSAGTVKAGRWLSRYDGKTYTAGSKLDIDHMVPLAEAWVSGAWKWSAEKREAYANDLGYDASLVAVSKHASRSKGDRDPSEWMPTAKSYRCTYVKSWIAVKHRWRLSIDRHEKDALKAALRAYCDSTAVARPAAPVMATLIGATKPAPIHTPAPTIAPVPVATTAPVVVPAPVAVPAPVTIATSAPALYANCDAVYAAGIASIGVGSPGYSPSLDGDNDGVACEVDAPVAAPTPIYTAAPTSTYTPSPAPAGATARCRDGSYSYSASRSGTCSYHGGVSTWL